MKVYSDPDLYNSGNSVVTLGMFDGVHIGHQQLLSSVIQRAKENKARAVVVTFWPHPRIVLNKNPEDLKFITSIEEKIKLLEEQGVDDLILLPFTLELAALSASDFIEDILIKKFGMTHLVMGYNHRFGKDRVDDYVAYQQIAENNNIGISKVDAVKLDGTNVSSTAVRNAILSGDISLANKFLAHHFSIQGKVVSGQQLGRTIGFPTANIQVNDSYKIIPKAGVYACRLFVKGKSHKGMLNVGYRPTVNADKKQQTVEVHIFDFNEDIYAEELELFFVDRVRDELKFKGVDELKSQLCVDEQIVRKILNH